MVRCRLLGGPDLRAPDGRELREVLTQPKRFALLAYLALARPQAFHRRDTILALLWPESDTAHARNALRQALHHLRAALGDDVLINRGSDEVGLASERFWCDAAEFERALEAGDFAAAADLYRGELLPGFFVSDAPEFERWLDGERRRLRGRAADAGWRLATGAAQAGNGPVATHWGRWAAQLAPDDEGAWRRYIELCIRLGDRGGALRAYDELVERLAREFDTAPSPETRALGSRLREQPAPERLGRPLHPAPAAPAGPRVPSTPPAARAHRLLTRPAVLAAIAALVVLGAFAARRGGIAPGIPSADAVAVFPFGVRGSDDLLYLREGMVDLLSAKLEDAPSLRSVDPRVVIAAAGRGDATLVADPGDVGAIARSLGAGWYVVGDVVEIAGRVNLSAALYRVRGGARPAATGSVEGESAALFELVDGLAGQLLAGRAGGRDSALTQLAALTTHSLPALKAFLDGERAFRQGHDARAVGAFEEAVTLDSTFSLAHYRLAIAGRWATGAPVPAAVSAATAVRYADRLSPLVRDLLSAYRAYLDLRADEAESVYRRITQSHPDNFEAWFMLGETWFHMNGIRGRPLAEARGPFERVLALDPGDAHALIHLARLAALQGAEVELDTLASRFIARYPDAERTLEMRALHAYVSGDETDQAALAVPPQSAPELARYAVLDAVANYAQDLRGAAELAPAYSAGIAHPWLRRLTRSLTTQIAFARGMWRGGSRDLAPRLRDADWTLNARALAAADPVFAFSRADLLALRDSVSQRRTLGVQPRRVEDSGSESGPAVRAYLLGLLSARLGDWDGAERHAAELERLSAAPADSGMGRDLAHTVRAAVVRNQGRSPAALAELEQFRFDPGGVTFQRPALVGAYERFLRGELLHALGRDTEALQWYGSFPAGFDIAYVPLAHLRQAEIHERLGRRERAAFHYRRFVSMWQDCDPELRPLVIEAERALARLQESR